MMHHLQNPDVMIALALIVVGGVVFVHSWRKERDKW